MSFLIICIFACIIIVGVVGMIIAIVVAANSKNKQIRPQGMYCSGCGAALPIDNKYCDKCGKEV